MPQLLYLSKAKLRQWPIRPSLGRQLARRAGGKLGGGPVPGEIAISPAAEDASDRTSLFDDYKLVRRVINDLESSPRFSRWVTDTVVAPGDWVQFDGRMQYGRICREGRGKTDRPSANIVFFVGSFPQPEPTVDLMLGGWIGHMLDEAARDPTLRMGSRTEHLYDLWDELTQAEEEGSFDVPESWRRLHREVSPGDYLTLDTICVMAYGMMVSHLPYITESPLKGHAQLLTRVQGGVRPLLVATPLYIEYSTPPEGRRVPPGNGRG